MPQASPYQPALLRILHGVAAVLAILALISGFWVYNTYDKRWGGFVLPQLGDIQGIHGTIALMFLLLLPVFSLAAPRLCVIQFPCWLSAAGSRAILQPVTTTGATRLVGFHPSSGQYRDAAGGHIRCRDGADDERGMATCGRGESCLVSGSFMRMGMRVREPCTASIVGGQSRWYALAHLDG